MSQLIGLADFCGELNISGLLTIEYVPTAWVDEVTFEERISPIYNMQQDLRFRQGGWLKAGILPTKRIWREDQQTSKQGVSYDQFVNCIAPNLRPSVAGELRKMANYRYLLRLKDTNQQKWILGTIEQPFDFVSKGTTGENGSLKHHALEFKSKTRHKAYGFEPIFP